MLGHHCWMKTKTSERVYKEMLVVVHFRLRNQIFSRLMQIWKLYMTLLIANFCLLCIIFRSLFYNVYYFPDVL